MCDSTDALSNTLISALSTDLHVSGWRPEMADNPTAFYYAGRQIQNSLLKKWVGDAFDEKAADAAALELWLQCNSRCTETFRYNTATTYWRLFDRARKRVSDIANYIHAPMTLESLQEEFSLGSGSNVLSEDTNIYQKLYSGRVTCSTNVVLQRSYDEYINSDTNSRRAENQRQIWFGPIVIVKGNKLSFVRKTRKISRVICTEPTVNMLYQQAIDKKLRAFIKNEFSINLNHQQEVNRRLAIQGSIDGSLCTIDCSSFSDTISVSFVRWFFGLIDAQLPDILGMCRSRYTELPSGDFVHLNMFSSMGNGYTFSLQTLILAALTEAAYELCGLPFNSHTYGVNGDDLIVNRKVYELMLNVLTDCGFIPNPDKSFNEGKFRESCGVDAFNGFNVRGLYLTSLNTQQECYVALNNIVDWTARTGISLLNLHRLIMDILKALQWAAIKAERVFEDRMFYIPLSGNPDSGLRVPWGYYILECGAHYGADENSDTVYGWFAKCMKTKLHKVPRFGIKVRYIKTAGHPTRISRVIDNPFGILLAGLQYNIGLGVVHRQRCTSYELKEIKFFEWNRRLWDQPENTLAVSDMDYMLSCDIYYPIRSLAP